ncbi:MAG: protein phosphatase 2C domain-containing protein [Clostridia bacterium]|nr:protein phosphatase 2C domain-containing protein [Clostridia bacterium]
MKKVNRGLNSIFTVAEEMVKTNGEDCFYHDVAGDNFIIAVFDGLGGSGSKKYANYSGKTGAYIASRAVCGGVREWFIKSYKHEELYKYIQDSLEVCQKYADPSGRIKGSLGKPFPTTAAIITGKTIKDKTDITCFWAGDSRCYMLDKQGLHQLTEDDLDGQDAMSNLTDDGVMTNVINASTDFKLHAKRISIDHPCILLSATDGCFGYLKSPMHFEHLITSSLIESRSVLEWKHKLNEKIFEVTGDDYTLSAAVCGFEDSFNSIKSAFVKRALLVKSEYINPQYDINSLWGVYKKDYSMYLET